MTSLAREFPGTLPARVFVDRTIDLLAPYGFTADNALACVGLCRDELAQPLATLIAQVWGEAFNFSSLGGIMTLGRTGFGAARTHSPIVDGRERFVFFSMPHTAIDHTGVLGQIRRRGQDVPTPVCGALVALQGQMRTGQLSADIDPDDFELSLLRQRVSRFVTGSPADCADDLAQLTRWARQIGLEDLERLISLGDMDKVDYAVFSAVQIHTPDGELVWPAEAYVSIAGQRSKLRVPH